jgi:hypothetical protein
MAKTNVRRRAVLTLLAAAAVVPAAPANAAPRPAASPVPECAADLIGR